MNESRAWQVISKRFIILAPVLIDENRCIQALHRLLPPDHRQTSYDIGAAAFISQKDWKLILP
jgi:hypothetical protein